MKRISTEILIRIERKLDRLIFDVKEIGCERQISSDRFPGLYIRVLFAGQIFVKRPQDDSEKLIYDLFAKKYDYDIVETIWEELEFLIDKVFQPKVYSRFTALAKMFED